MAVKFKNQIVWLLFALQVRYGNDLWSLSCCPWGLMARNVVEIMNGMRGMSGMLTHDARLSTIGWPGQLCIAFNRPKICDTFHILLCCARHTVAMRLRQSRGQLRLQITNDQQDLATSHSPDQTRPCQPRPLMVIFKVLSAQATTTTAAAAAIATMR